MRYLPQENAERACGKHGARGILRGMVASGPLHTIEVIIMEPGAGYNATRGLWMLYDFRVAGLREFPVRKETGISLETVLPDAGSPGLTGFLVAE